VAAEWVRANTDTVNKWLDGVTTIDGGDAIAAVAAALK
jgi:glycine betaine/proline transport system substrate-binding protein